jgi:hypothetical protein
VESSTNDVISIEIPVAEAGGVAHEVEPGAPYPPANLQAWSQDGKTGTIDVLPGGVDAILGDASVPMFLEQATYPVCTVHPGLVSPPDRVFVHATGFGADRTGATVTLTLGDEVLSEEVALGEDGTVDVSGEILADAEVGLRQLSVQLTGTALTADCLVQVGDPVPLDE